MFPTHKDGSQIDAQDLLATVMMDPVTQTLFNAKKGSVPARIDVDACTLHGLSVLAVPRAAAGQCRVPRHR